MIQNLIVYAAIAACAMFICVDILSDIKDGISARWAKTKINPDKTIIAQIALVSHCSMFIPPWNLYWWTVGVITSILHRNFNARLIYLFPGYASVGVLAAITYDKKELSGLDIIKYMLISSSLFIPPWNIICWAVALFYKHKFDREYGRALMSMAPIVGVIEFLIEKKK